MNNGYKQRIQKISKWLEDSKLADYARKENSHAFSRNRKMPLKDILLSCLSKKVLQQPSNCGIILNKMK